MLRFVGDEDQKKITKNPLHFSMQNSQANTKKIFTKFFWRGGKVTFSLSGSIKSTYVVRGTVPKGSATQSGPLPEKSGKPPGLETPRFSFSQIRENNYQKGFPVSLLYFDFFLIVTAGSLKHLVFLGKFSQEISTDSDLIRR